MGGRAAIPQGKAEKVKIHPIIATVIVSAVVAIQAWTLTEVIALKVSVAQLTERLNARTLAHTP